VTFQISDLTVQIEIVRSAKVGFEIRPFEI